jgi:hypothetical protein
MSSSQSLTTETFGFRWLLAAFMTALAAVLLRFGARNQSRGGRQQAVESDFGAACFVLALTGERWREHAKRMWFDTSGARYGPGNSSHGPYFCLSDCQLRLLVKQAVAARSYYGQRT